MKKNNFNLTLIPILLTQVLAWAYALVYVPLAYMYDSFPGMDAQVMTIATAPGIAAMISCFLSAAISEKIGYKNTVIMGLVTIFSGAMLIRFFGTGNIVLAIIGSALTGFSGGMIPAANYAILGEIAPDNMRSKVIGWCDAATGVGTMLGNFLAGIFSANGNWARAFDFYFLAVPVLLLTIALYPSTAKLKELAPQQKSSSGVAAAVEPNFVPKGINTILILRFVTALFYMIPLLFRSSLIINEFQLGSSVAVGNISSLCGLVSAVVGSIFFILLNRFKGFTVSFGFALMGIASLIMAFDPNLIVVSIMCMLATFGMQVHVTGMGTVVSMGPKGKIRARYTSISLGLMFIGEFLAGYVCPLLSDIFSLPALPSVYMKISGVILVVIAVICVPFYRTAYEGCFPSKKTNEV